LQRILWRENPNEEHREYRLTTIMYVTIRSILGVMRAFTGKPVTRNIDFPKEHWLFDRTYM